MCTFVASVAQAVTFNILSCCPGEDTATQARFVWHSDSNACTLWYAKASAPGSATQVSCESVYKPISFRSSDVNYYKYTATLSSLDPGTEYIYYVKSGSTQSATQRFKTAGTSGSYNFLWLSDVHSHPDDSAKTNSVNTIIANAKSAAGSIDFILFSGDMVKYGARYDNWQQWNGNASFTDYMHALCPGNKEYYNTGGTTAGANGSSSRIHNRWFLACRNNPQNGADGIESSYWFIRDSVMFVAMDTLADEGVDMDSYVYNNAFALQTNWFDRVVSAQKSAKSFRYLVVFQHYPHFTYAEGDGFQYGSGRYKKWKDLFDKHKVDFALTGDHHNYSRSKKLRSGSENSEGTVYITAPEIGKSLYSPSVKTASNLNSYGVTSGDNPTVKTLMATAHNGDEAVGGVWFSVTPGKMKMHYIGTSTSPYDTVEVTPKDRGFVYSPGGGTTGGGVSPHARYRFAVDSPRSDTWCMQLSEIELLDASGNVIPSSSFTIAYDSTTHPADGGDPYPSSECPSNAVDGVHTGNGKWLDWRAGLGQSAAVRSAVWLDFCFAEPTAVSGYRWYTANDDSDYPGRTPVAWTFSASDDGGVTWSVIDKVTSYDTTTANNTLAYVTTWQLAGSDAFTWKGGYDANRISSGRNWEGGVAPTANSGATLTFPFTSNTTVSNDYASLSAKKIVFPASNYRATFVGGPVTIAESIVNNASVTNKFQNAVTFAGNIDVTGAMDFSGGVTGTVPSNHTTYRGNYNLTTTSSWTPASGSRVPSGSTLSMPNGTFYCHVNSLTIERNATVTVQAAKMDRTSVAYLLGENDGVFKTTGVLTSSGTSSVYHYLLHTSAETSSEGLIALDGLKINGSPIVYANSYGGKYQMAIGNNGIKKDVGVAGYFLIRNDNKPEYIGSWCNGNDYKIAIVDSNGSYPTSTSEYVLYGSKTDRTYNINFDTTDCFNAGVRNTVRDMSPICGAVPANVSVGIYGGGTFTFENTAVNATGLYSGGTVVSNSATVAILAGSCPGRGNLTLRDTATLSLPGSASGTATVFGTLSLASGTTVSFGRLASGTTPLSVGGLTVGAGTPKPVISVDVSSLAAGTYPLIVSSSATSATADSFTLSTTGASDKPISLVKSGNSICLEVLAGVHGKWLGGNGNNRFSVAANWDDGQVPGAGDALDFSSVTSATTIEADVNATFGAITMGSGVVTFTGGLTASSYSDLSKITVGANATVTLVGDLTYTATMGGGWILNRLDGTFVVTGKIVVSGTADMKLAQTVGASGVAVVKGLVSSGGTPWTFRLNRSNSGDTARWVIGEDGLSGSSGFWMLAATSSSSAILQPNTNDFVIADWIGAREGPSLTINTTGWGDGVGHVVTATNAGFIREGDVNVTGAGALVCNYNASAGAYGQSAHSVVFTVKDTATFALKAGSNIGMGNVTVNSGAALALSGTGMATMGGTLTLQGGSRIVVGAAGAGLPPYLTAKGVSLAGNNVTVEIPSQIVGTFTVLMRTDGTFTNSDLAKLSLSVAVSNASLASSLVLADGGKSVAVSTVAVWPANWNGGHAANAAMQAAFAEWAATPGNDATAARAEGAFLLGLDLADYTEDLKVVAVALQGNKFTIDTNVDLTKVRGRLYVLVADSPADIEKSGTKINGTVANLSKLINIDASAPAKFFKVGIDYAVGGD